jgi:hypothetical protein
MQLKYFFISITILLCFTANTFCQKSSIKKVNADKPSLICRDSFLLSQIYYSDIYSKDIILPVTITNDNYRIIIKSKYFHQYLTVMAAKSETEMNLDSTLLDSTTYFSKALSIIKGKEKLEFNRWTFETFVKNGSYVLLDRINPYSIEIKREGLGKFIKKIFYSTPFKKGNNVTYSLIYLDKYEKPNQYNLNYLIEALFEYNFKYINSDGFIGFIKVGCGK